MPEKNNIPIFKKTIFQSFGILMECTTAWFVMVYMSTDAFLICPKPSKMRSWQSITRNNSDGFVAISA